MTGVKSKLKPEAFFDKCISGTLQDCDFDLGDKSRKGSIRRKISVLKTAVDLFDGTYKINAPEMFIKNKIVCSFATSDGICTAGFILENGSKQLTLLKGNELDNSKPVELII